MGAVTWTSRTSRGDLGTPGAINDNAADLSSELDNGTNLDKFMDVEVLLASFTPGSNPYVKIQIIYEGDGATYEDGNGTTDPGFGTPTYRRGVQGGASAKRVVFSNIPIAPMALKILVHNETGATWASSGNTVGVWTYNPTVA